MQSSYSSGFPATPSRALMASQFGQQQQQQAESSNAAMINNARAGGMTPRRKSTLTPSRYIPPSPLPGLHASYFQGAASAAGGGIGSSQSSTTSTTAGGQYINFQDPKYRVLSANNNTDLRNAIEQSQNLIDSTLKNLKHGKSERRRAHEALKVELLEEDRRWEGECEKLRGQGADMVKALEREKGEIADATTKLTQLENRKRAFAAQLEALKVELGEWQTKIEKIKDVNAREKTAYEQQAKRDAPDVSFLQLRTGLRIEGRPRNIVSFSFTLIDPSDHKRIFEIQLDATGPDYTIASCKPDLSHSTVLKPLLDKLNDDRDLYSFLKSVRGAFVDLVKREEKDRHAAAGFAR